MAYLLYYFAPKIVTRRIMKRKKKTDIVEAWSHKHDYPIEEVWNTDNIIARLIVPRLKAFKALDKHGHPGDIASMEAWHKVIDKMIYAFELNMHAGALSQEERKDFEEGFELFYKYYLYLWD